MSHPVPVRRALLSVSDKTDLVAFARALTELGVEIISTGGTARALNEVGITVIPVDSITGFPEMMDGRVKTLHPAVHGALLARRDVESHVAALESHDITPIDLVVVNLYPFEQTVLDPEVSDDEAIEQIDIGGPAILRSAAKNHAFTAVVTSPTQYDSVVTVLNNNDGATTLELRRDLAAAAFARTAEYDTAISSWMSTSRGESFPAMLRMSFTHQRDLRYGENPHQKAAVYANPQGAELSIVKSVQLHGKPLSYNNVNDADAALELVVDLHALEPECSAAAIIKHASPCGAARAADARTAFELAYASDPLAAYGGILALSTRVDMAAAEAMCEGSSFLEVILAPGYDDDALERLRERWKMVRLLEIGDPGRAATHSYAYRGVLGGLLMQERDTHLAAPHEWGHAAGPKPSDDVLRDAAFAWTVAKHVKSNAIAISRGGQLLGAGGGQVDRVSSCKGAIEKCAGRIANGEGPAIAASDAFFPFPDGPELLIDAGVKVILHPGGSKRDEETFALCDERGVTCMVTGVRHFRH